MEADLSEEVPHDVSGARAESLLYGESLEVKGGPLRALKELLGQSSPRQCILGSHS